jgi:translocation protein SEC63
MGRAQFEYDEVGNTFYYVVISFYAVILVPLTYILWPSPPHENAVDESGCQCNGCKVKRDRKRAIKPWEYTKQGLKALVLLILWAAFIYISFKVSQIEHINEEYDPYKILGLDTGAEPSEIKKKYRELTKTHHPDRGGNEQQFDLIAKAYQALTNDESRENWEKYGNPDGPKAMTFGIALPKWIVSDQYGGWVLALYVGVFMIILPIFVGIWWQRSMKYSADKVLIETTRAFYHFLTKTPSMNIIRALTVISGAYEFCKKFNAEIIERDSDEFEVKPLMKECRQLGDSKKEAPFFLPWSIKARTLLHAYLTRLPLPSERLEQDQKYYVTRVLSLVEEFIRMHVQVYHHIPVQRPPTLETLENLLKFPPMFVQALWPQNSSILQLPHIQDNNIPFLRRKRVFTCADLAALDEHRRRNLLNTLEENEYEDVIKVLQKMPKLEIETRIEVQGEDDKDQVTSGSLVTLKVTLKRTPLLDRAKRAAEIAEGPKVVEKEEKEDEEPVKQRKPWEKQQKKKPKAGKKGGKQPTKKRAPASVASTVATTAQAVAEAAGPSNGTVARPPRDENNDESGGSESETNETDTESDEVASIVNEVTSNQESSDEDDDLWEDGMARKEALLEKEPTDNHEVHAPYYPLDKFEWWYLYLIEKKSRRLQTYVIPCKTLKDTKTMELKFAAPNAKGVYQYQLNVKSDSYLDSDYTHDIRLEVLEAREPPPVKYVDTEDEDEGNDGGLSEYTEGSDESDED